jgi:hypothetical protein
LILKKPFSFRHEKWAAAARFRITGRIFDEFACAVVESAQDGRAGHLEFPLLSF